MHIWRDRGGTLLRIAKRRAAKSQVPFSLTTDHALELLKAQQFRCAVSGLPLAAFPGSRSSYDPYGVSVDRIDPYEGYVEGNVRLVALIVNVAMSRWGEAPLLRMAESLVALSVAPHATKGEGPEGP